MTGNPEVEPRTAKHSAWGKVRLTARACNKATEHLGLSNRPTRRKFLRKAWTSFVKVLEISIPRLSRFCGDFAFLDCPLGTQSHANSSARLETHQVTSFCHGIARRSPLCAMEKRMETGLSARLEDAF